MENKNSKNPSNNKSNNGSRENNNNNKNKDKARDKNKDNNKTTINNFKKIKIGNKINKTIKINLIKIKEVLKKVEEISNKNKNSNLIE